MLLVAARPSQEQPRFAIAAVEGASGCFPRMESRRQRADARCLDRTTACGWRSRRGLHLLTLRPIDNGPRAKAMRFPPARCPRSPALRLHFHRRLKGCAHENSMRGNASAGSRSKLKLGRRNRSTARCCRSASQGTRLSYAETREERSSNTASPCSASIRSSLHGADHHPPAPPARLRARRSGASPLTPTQPVRGAAATGR